MLMDASQAVLKIQDFVKMLGENEISVFTNRMRIMEVARSLRILPIDAEREAFEYVERTFTGVADLLDRAGKDLAGAAGLPQTVLFGMSPAGLNATGESDIRGWYDQIQAERTKKIQPLLESLVYYAAIVAGADAPETWGVKWNPLWQESAGEQAGRYKTVAETDQIYVNLGVVTEDEVAETRFSGDEFNDGPIQLDMETRSSLREMDLERVAEGVPEPEPEPEPEPTPEPEDADDPA
jgi:phage-related protein (TIGR01555 family)